MATVLRARMRQGGPTLEALAKLSGVPIKRLRKLLDAGADRHWSLADFLSVMSVLGADAAGFVLALAGFGAVELDEQDPGALAEAEADIGEGLGVLLRSTADGHVGARERDACDRALDTITDAARRFRRAAHKGS